MRFDKDNIDNITSIPITIFEETEFKGSQLWFGHNINSIYNSDNNNFVIKLKNKFIIRETDSVNNRLLLDKNELNVYNTKSSNR